MPVSSDQTKAGTQPLRLRKRREFLAVQAGEKWRGPHFLLEVRAQPANLTAKGAASARIGFTVSKKCGNAVRRNRIRRRLREAVRVGAAGCLVPGYDYVIVARPDLLTLPFDRLIGEIRRRVGVASKKAARSCAPVVEAEESKSQ